MLHTLQLVNFRKHEDVTFTFGKGLNAIKGANEAGKSTILIAALYALYGAKTLPLPLADMVTWGKKESDLKVSLTIGVRDRLFTFSRSKSGAECLYDGGIVTGQNEVSNFAAEILGGDRDLVCRLMLANQTNLRGALEEGPKAVSSMIESLADFDLFDRIMDSAQHNLTTGPTAALEEKLRTLDEQLATSKPEPPTVANIMAEIGGYTSQIQEHQGKVESLVPVLRAAENAYASAQATNRMRDNIAGNLKKAEEQQKLHAVQKAEADKKAAVVVDLAELAALKKQLESISEVKKRAEIYAELVKLKARYPDAFWEGTKAEFDAALTEVMKEREDYRADIQKRKDRIKDIEHELKLLESKIVSSSVCPTCGSDVSKNAVVQAANAKLGASIATLSDEKLGAYAQLAGIETTYHHKLKEVDDYNAITTSAVPFERFAVQYGQFVEVNLNCYPPELSWKGPTPEGASCDQQQYKDRIVSLESAKETAERANARSVALAETLKEDEEYLARLNEQLAACPPQADVDSLHAEARHIGNEISNLNYQIKNCQESITALEKSVSDLELTYKLQMQRYEEAERNVEVVRKELDTLNFNNTLLKKIRTARPVISDKLWGLTLSAVSTMFSQMRGEKSVVTKNKDGFAVNGKPVQGLSGSTLDLLGLAIRCALLHTFLPHVSFIALDEPASGCDENRTASLLGFVAASGFQQAIVISHEDATEAAADHIIAL